MESFVYSMEIKEMADKFEFKFWYILLIPMDKLLLDNCPYMMKLLQGFSVLSKDTLICGQDQQGVELLILLYLSV